LSFDFRELSEEFSLPVAELLWSADEAMHDLITPSSTADIGHSLAAKSQKVSRLRARGNVDLVFSCDGRDIDLGSEGSLREGEVEATDDVFAVPLEDLVGSHSDKDIEIPGGAAQPTWLAFSCEAQTHAVVDAGGDIDGQLPASCNPSSSRAIAAVLGVRTPFATAGGAGRTNLKKSLSLNHFAVATAGTAGDGLGSRLPSGAAAGLAGFVTGELYIFASALDRSVEVDGHVVSDIVAACGTVAAAAAAPSPTPKEVSEHVSESGEDVVEAALEALVARSTKAFVPEAIIPSPLLLIGEYVVGLSSFLKLGCRFWVVGVPIRMELHCKLAIRFLHRGRIGVPWNSEHLVVIAFFAHSSFSGARKLIS
jgi:hypothetical protein